MPTFVDEPANDGMISKMATVAPKAAPCEMPTVDAEANGFSSTLCRAAPASAKPAPATMAHTTRGRRMERTVMTSWEEPNPNSA